MALIKEITFPSGSKASYHRVVSMKMDKEMGIVTIGVQHFFDVNKRTDGSPSDRRGSFTVRLVDIFPTGDGEIAYWATLYEALKSLETFAGATDA